MKPYKQSCVDNAARAINAHQHAKGTVIMENDEDIEEDITDILPDLLHYCEKHKVDFDVCAALAKDHYRYEITEEEQTA